MSDFDELYRGEESSSECHCAYLEEKEETTAEDDTDRRKESDQYPEQTLPGLRVGTQQLPIK